MYVNAQLLKFHRAPADSLGMVDPPDLELMANRFVRLVRELLQGKVRRNTFEPWEVRLLLDLDACGLTRSRRDEALRRYQRVVERQLEQGELPPVTFADFVGRRKREPVLAQSPPLPAPESASGQDSAAFHS